MPYTKETRQRRAKSTTSARLALHTLSHARTLLHHHTNLVANLLCACLRTAQIQTEFLPWLFERVADDVDQRSSVRDTVSGLLESVADAAETARSTRTEARREGEETRQKAASIARARIIQLFLPITLIGEEDGGTRLGPVSVKAGDTVQSAEAKVATWLREEGKVEDVSQPEGGFFAGYLREARRTGGTVRVGKTSMLLELQERVGVSDEILLEVAADS